MIKPDPKAAPPWAKFLAMQRDGNWWWFESEPTLVGRAGAEWWYLECGPRRQIAAEPIDPKDTLERVNNENPNRR